MLRNIYSVLWQSGHQSPSKLVRLKQGRIITSNCLPHAALISFQLSSDVCSESGTHMQTFLVSPRPWAPPSPWLWHQGPQSPEEEQLKWPVPRHRRPCGTWACSLGHRPTGGGFLPEQKLSSTELSSVSQGSLAGCARRLLLKEMCAVSHEHYRLHAGGQVGQWDQRVFRFHIEIMEMCLCFCLPLQAVTQKTHCCCQYSFPCVPYLLLLQSHDIFHQLEVVYAREGFTTWVECCVEYGYLGRLGWWEMSQV